MSQKITTKKYLNPLRKENIRCICCGKYLNSKANKLSLRCSNCGCNLIKMKKLSLKEIDKILAEDLEAYPRYKFIELRQILERCK